MASRGRYLSPAEFGRLLADLRITSNMFQSSLLEWLERERIVPPVARIRWPDSIVRENRGIEVKPGPTDEERRSTEALGTALRLWSRFDADPEASHPLDQVDPPGASLVKRNVGSRPFEAWDSMRTNVAPAGEAPLYVSDGVDTYYHDWQAVLVADALRMGVRLVFDTREPHLLELAIGGDLAQLASVDGYQLVSFEAPRGLRDGLRWASFMDAAGRVDIVRKRKLAAISNAHGNDPFTLKGAELDDYNAMSSRAALASLAGIGGSLDDLVLFIAYLCDRWNEWSRHGRAELAGEYEQHLRRAIRLTMDGFDIPLEALDAQVSEADGGGRTKLSTIFPDWSKNARDQLDRSLRRVVLPGAPFKDQDLALTDADITDLLDWMSNRRSWKIHLSVEEIIKRQFGSSPVSHEAHAAAVEALGVTFEQLVGELLDEANLHLKGTLMRKLQRLWSSDPDVSRVLTTMHGLVSTGNATRAHQLAQIAGLPSNGARAEISQIMLRVVLYRNDGLHNSMSSWSEGELYDATVAFLTALLLCRKQTLVNPPKP